MTTKRTLAISIAILALAAGGCGGDDDDADAGSGTTETQTTGGPSAQAKGKVDIKDFKFVPETVNVKAGGAITFANSDKAKHTAQTDSDAAGAFNTGDLEKGDSKAVTFDEPGTYEYYCIYHRFMTATVEVSE